MRDRFLAGFGLGLMMICGACAASAADVDAPFWPSFHGPHGDNKSPDTGLLPAWPEGGPTLLWTAQDLGHGYGGITTAAGRLYTTGQTDETSLVHCLDLSGKFLWTAENGPAWTGGYPGSRATPAIDADRVYNLSPLGHLVCLEAATGKQIWELNILEQYGGTTPVWALAESVTIDGDQLICCPFGSRASIVALDKMTGRELWKAPPVGDDAKAGYATPVIREYAGRRIVLTMSGKGLVGVDADNGAMLFTYPHATNYDINATTPIFHEGHIFITSGYGTTGSKMLKLNVEGDRFSVSQVWANPELDNQHGGVVLHDGFLYGSAHRSGRGHWMCVDWKTGETKYSERGIGQGCLTFADGMLYTMSERRTIGLVRATPDKYDLISQFDIPNQGTGASWAHPVVIGGRLYIRHGDFLYCYDVTGR